MPRKMIGVGHGGFSQTFPEDIEQTFDGPAELPRDEVDFSLPSTSTTITVRETGGDFTTWQAAWDAVDRSAGGVLIELEAGYDVGPLTTGAQDGDDEHFVVSAVENVATALPRHVRVGEADEVDMFHVPVISGGAFSPAMTVGSDTKRHRVIGASFKVPAAQAGVAVIQFDHANGGTEVPEHVVLDRCLGRGLGLDTNVRRGVGMNGKWVGMIDCDFQEYNDDGSDSQALFIYQGVGPYTFVNTVLGAGGENFIVGGASAASVDVIPSDLSFYRCHFIKNGAWFQDPSANIKNLFETKHCRRLLVEDAIFENNWAEAQSGGAILLHARDQNGTLPGTLSNDITIRYAIIRNIPWLFSISRIDGTETAQELKRVSIHDIVAYNVGADNPFTEAIESRRGLAQLAGGIGPISFRRITVVMPDGGSAMYFATNQTTIVEGLTLEDVILGQAEFGIFGDGTGEGSATLNAHTTTFEVDSLHIYGYGSAPPDQYPAGTSRYADEAAIGFEDAANDDYRLAAGSALKGTGSDGGDPGAGVAEINTRTANVVSGDFSSDPWSS